MIKILTLTRCISLEYYFRNFYQKNRKNFSHTVLSNERNKAKILIKNEGGNIENIGKFEISGDGSVYDSLRSSMRQARLNKLISDSKLKYINKVEKAYRNYFKPPIIYEGPRNIIFWLRMKRPGRRS